MMASMRTTAPAATTTRASRLATQKEALSGQPILRVAAGAGLQRPVLRAIPVTRAAATPKVDQKAFEAEARQNLKSIRNGYASSYAEQPAEEALAVEGTLPEWLDGTIIRNGPGRYNVGDRDMPHMFGGYGLLTKVHFDGVGNAATLRTRFVQSKAYRELLKRGKQLYMEFGAPFVVAEKPTFKTRAQNLLGNMVSLGATDNANVNVVAVGGKVLAVSETGLSTYEVDPTTLETRGQWKWEAEKSGPGVGLLQTAHPQLDERGDLYNVRTDPVPGKGQGFQVVVTPKSNPKAVNVVATVKSALPTPGWVHSFAMSQRYVIILEAPAYYNLGSFVGVGDAEYQVFDWDASRGTAIHVVDKQTGSVSTKQAPTFFHFHLANAWEEVSEANGAVVGINIDVAMYDDLQIVNHLGFDILAADPVSPKYSQLPYARHARIKVPLGRASCSIESVTDDTVTGNYVDFGVINPQNLFSRSRYIYALSCAGPSSVGNSLSKTDTEGSGGRSWSEPGVLPGEPTFVPRPGGGGEDDGVVIALCNTPEGRSFAAVLDAETFELRAKVWSPEGRQGWPAGFHGRWFDGKV